MVNTSKTILVLNGVPHRIAPLIALAGAAPHLDVPIKDIHSFEGDKVDPAHKVSLENLDDKFTDDSVVLFKQGTGFTVLLGKELVLDAAAKGKAVVHAKLISTVGLKKTRVSETPVPVCERQDDRPYRAPRDDRSGAPNGGYRRNELQAYSSERPFRPR